MTLVERHRLLYPYLRSRADLLTDRRARLLHFAPERSLGRVFRAAPNLEHVTTDLHDPNVMIRMDITDILFRDDVFDVVVCNHVLEHVPDDMAAMREVRRVPKPSGSRSCRFRSTTRRRPSKTRRSSPRTSDATCSDNATTFGATVAASGPGSSGLVSHVTVEHYPEEFSAAEKRLYRFAPADIYVSRKGEP